MKALQTETGRERYNLSILPGSEIIFHADSVLKMISDYLTNFNNYK